MPRNGAGVASPVAGSNSVSSNTTILSSLENSLVNDLIAMFNTQWPVAIGGSGAISGDNFASLNNSTSILNNWLKDFGGTITAGGTATGLTATITQAFTAYGSGAGQLGNGTLLSLKTASAAAAGGTTLTVSATSSLGSKKVLRGDGSAIRTNDWGSGATIQLRYDSAADSAAGAYILLNASPAAVQTAQNRNIFVNPAMQISQENGTTSGTTNGYFPVDQWRMIFSSSGTFTTQQAAVATPGGSTSRTRVTITVADAALGAGDFLLVQQNIEGSALQASLFGTASARQLVLRFGFKGPAGTYSIALNGPSRYYTANFTISVANTDTVVTVLVPGDITGSWTFGAGSSVVGISIVLAAGSTFQGTAGAWTALGALIYGTSSNSNGMGTAAAVYELFDAGLYLDPLSTGTAPTYEVPDPAAELIRASRYYQQMTAMASNDVYGNGHLTSTTNARVEFPLVAPLSTTPTVTATTLANLIGISQGATGAVSAIASVNAPDTQRLVINFTIAAFAASNNPLSLRCSNAGDVLKINARI